LNQEAILGEREHHTLAPRERVAEGRVRVLPTWTSFPKSDGMFALVKRK